MKDVGLNSCARNILEFLSTSILSTYYTVIEKFFKSFLPQSSVMFGNRHVFMLHFISFLGLYKLRLFERNCDSFTKQYRSSLYFSQCQGNREFKGINGRICVPTNVFYTGCHVNWYGSQWKCKFKGSISIPWVAIVTLKIGCFQKFRKIFERISTFDIPFCKVTYVKSIIILRTTSAVDVSILIFHFFLAVPCLMQVTSSLSTNKTTIKSNNEKTEKV